MKVARIKVEVARVKVTKSTNTQRGIEYTLRERAAQICHFELSHGPDTTLRRDCYLPVPTIHDRCSPALLGRKLAPGELTSVLDLMAEFGLVAVHASRPIYRWSRLATPAAIQRFAGPGPTIAKSEWI